MPFQHGKFGPAKSSKPGAVKSTGSKPPSEPPMHDKGGSEHGDKQAAHGETGEKHVTETHPGETQPHPTTGVHAFHGHHSGGGKYKSFTHHDGGDVEERQHESAGDMHSAMNESLPDQGGDMNQSQDGGMDYGADLGGIGGQQSGQ